MRRNIKLKIEIGVLGYFVAANFLRPDHDEYLSQLLDINFEEFKNIMFENNGIINDLNNFSFLYKKDAEKVLDILNSYLLMIKLEE